MTVMRKTLAEEDGQVHLEGLKTKLKAMSDKDILLEYGYPKAPLLKAISQLKKYDENNDGKICQEEWNKWMNGKMKSSFAEKHPYTQIVCPIYMTFSPPPVFIPTMCLLQIMFYMISNYAGGAIGSTYTDNTEGSRAFLDGLGHTPLIYHPCKREQIWRFFTYMFLHADPVHLSFNVGLQLLVGVVLEMEQPGWLGTLRVAGLFVSGVFVGALGSGISEQKFAVGSSAGTYALIMAHFASIILNWEDEKNLEREMTVRLDEGDIEEGVDSTAKPRKGYTFTVPFYLSPMLKSKRFLFVFLFMFVDACLTLKNVLGEEDKSVSRAAHLFGAATGLLL